MINLYFIGQLRSIHTAFISCIEALQCAKVFTCGVHVLQAFASYLAYKKDNNELLLFILKQLAGDHLTFNRNRYGGDLDVVEVPEQEFVEKVSVCVSHVCMHACMYSD